MGRAVTSNLATILAGPRQIDYLVDLTFSDASVLRYATSPLTVGGNDYANRVEDVREIRQTIEAVPDRVGIELDNRDRALSLHLAANWEKWRTCEAVIRRYYRGGTGFATTETVEVFRGMVQQPEADDRRLSFDVLHDVLTPGDIVASDTLNPLCQNVFKDPKTCGYAGSATSCDHHLRSKTGCDGLGNSHRFRGMEHRYNPDAAAPGGGGNPGGGIGYCPRKDQWVIVRRDDKRIAVRAGDLTRTDSIWNPVLRAFIPIRSLTFIPDQPIWELILSNGAVGYASFSHPVIRSESDRAGTAIRDLRTQDKVLTETRGAIGTANILLSCPSDETADVVLIEMEGSVEEKIYCWGDNPEKMIVCHNAKPEVPVI